jgi:gamma-glutamylcyclotransferase (GGCT)/AIG2-like uncharacterized protein YtfP
MNGVTSVAPFCSVLDLTGMLLFSYGTLQAKDIQRAVFGREVEGREDSLPGYEVCVLGVGGAQYANLTRSTSVEHAVRGTALEVTQQELEAADAYEEDAKYKRLRVTLASGDEAWVYIYVE